MKNLQPIIDQAYEQRQQLSEKNVPRDVYDAVQTIVERLDRGEIRTAEKQNDQWIVHQWIKKAILLYFKIEPFKSFDAGYAAF
jgi:2,3,4,5-tetrahydropyridine-2-carboxylate N-succinyltransferase